MRRINVYRRHCKNDHFFAVLGSISKPKRQVLLGTEYSGTFILEFPDSRTLRNVSVI